MNSIDDLIPTPKWPILCYVGR